MARAFHPFADRITPLYCTRSRGLDNPGAACFTALISGFAEAFLLYVLVQAATEIAGGGEFTDIAIGPLNIDNVSVSSMLAAGIGK